MADAIPRLLNGTLELTTPVRAWLGMSVIMNVIGLLAFATSLVRHRAQLFDLRNLRAPMYRRAHVAWRDITIPSALDMIVVLWIHYSWCFTLVQYLVETPVFYAVNYSRIMTVHHVLSMALCFWITTHHVHSVYTIAPMCGHYATMFARVLHAYILYEIYILTTVLCFGGVALRGYRGLIGTPGDSAETRASDCKLALVAGFLGFLHFGNLVEFGTRIPFVPGTTTPIAAPPRLGLVLLWIVLHGALHVTILYGIYALVKKHTYGETVRYHDVYARVLAAPWRAVCAAGRAFGVVFFGLSALVRIDWHDAWECPPALKKLVRISPAYKASVEKNAANVAATATADGSGASTARGGFVFNATLRVAPNLTLLRRQCGCYAHPAAALLVAALATLALMLAAVFSAAAVSPGLLLLLAVTAVATAFQCEYVVETWTLGEAPLSDAAWHVQAVARVVLLYALLHMAAWQTLLIVYVHALGSGFWRTLFYVLPRAENGPLLMALALLVIGLTAALGTAVCSLVMWHMRRLGACLASRDDGVTPAAPDNAATEPTASWRRTAATLARAGAYCGGRHPTPFFAAGLAVLFVLASTLVHFVVAYAADLSPLLLLLLIAGAVVAAYHCIYTARVSSDGLDAAATLDCGAWHARQAARSLALFFIYATAAWVTLLVLFSHALDAHVWEAVIDRLRPADRAIVVLLFFALAASACALVVLLRAHWMHVSAVLELGERTDAARDIAATARALASAPSAPPAFFTDYASPLVPLRNYDETPG